MKIKEALDIINSTKTVRAKFEDSNLTFATKKMLGDDHWGFWFLRMNKDTLGWYSVNFEHCYLDGASPQDLARTMDVVQRFIDTPVDKRKPEKKYRLRWLNGTNLDKKIADPALESETYLGRVADNFGNYYWSAFPDYSAEIFTKEQLEGLKRDNPKFAPAIDAMKEEVKDDD